MKKLICLLLAATSLYAAPQTIVFDFGGVMTGEPNREAVVEFLCASFQLTPSEFEKANLEKRQAMKLGKTDEEFWINFAHEKVIALPRNWSQQFKSVMKDAIGINPEMYVLVSELKEKQVPIALLSNIDERLSKLIREFGLYEPFNPCLLSCEIGAEKPNARAYEILLEKLDLPSAEIIFIDDREENVEAAKKLGLDAILFQSSGQIRQELKKRCLL